MQLRYRGPRAELAIADIEATAQPVEAAETGSVSLSECVNRDQDEESKAEENKDAFGVNL